MKEIEIAVNILDMQSKLEEMQGAGYEIAKMKIELDEYDSEIQLSAYDLQDEEEIDYGSIPEISSSLS